MASINRHFKLEGWLMVAAIALPLVLGIAAAVLVPFVRTQIAVDRCLDSGGKYNYETDACTPELKS